MSLSVVFDSAGTLMKTERAVFSRETGEITLGLETTLLVFEDKDRVLVLINAGNCDILSGNPNMPLFSWISENNISYAVSCGHGTFEDATRIIKNDSASILQNLQDAALACKAEAEKENSVFALNTGLILNLRKNSIEFMVAAAGYPFHGVKEVIPALRDMGAEVFVASGDRQEKLEAAAEFLGIPKDHVFGAATPDKKAEIVSNLQSFGTVIMVGDGINDISAFHKADYAVLTVQQRGRRPDILFNAADFVIEDIREMISIAKRFV